MLRDGQFIKEPPIKIGAHYVPPVNKPASDEELVMQSLILDEKQPKETIKLPEGIFSILLLCSVIWMAAIAFKTLVSMFLG